MPPILASAGVKAGEIFAGLTFRLILIGIIAAMFVNTYVEIRIPIPLLPDIHWQGWKPLAIERGETIKGFAKAQELARKAAEAALRAKEAEYRRKAKDAENEHTTALDGAMDAADRYIASHRVCPSNRSAAGSTVASAEGSSAGVPEAVPASSFVAVSDADVQACSAAAAYAVKAHDWALDIAK